MDDERFGELSRRFAGAGSRRSALAALAAGIFGGVAGRGLAASAAEVDEAGIPIVSCKVPGELCQGDKACCSLRCKQGICACVEKGRRCWSPMEGTLCCSGRCHKGRCK